MNFAEAKRTAAKLFGPGLKLHRGKNRCFLLRADGLPIGDGRSWLECLRSAGEAAMLQNAKNDAEAARVKAMIEEFRKEHPGIDLEKELTKEQLDIFDAWVEQFEAKRNAPPPPPEPSRILGPDGKPAER